jgi:methionine synthase II (cobalamin-independent)
LAQQFPPASLIDSIARLSDHVSEPVELGWHFCYGDAGHKHMVEPRDMRLMTEKANALSHTVRRRVNWLHMPVPRDRVDDDYFSPLRELAIDAHTEIYLGLVHFTDGVEGARRRIAAANKVISHYGIATECGFGRRSPETVLPLLDLHRKIAEYA